jgi:hypothetical protein
MRSSSPPEKGETCMGPVGLQLASSASSPNSVAVKATLYSTNEKSSNFKPTVDVQDWVKNKLEEKKDGLFFLSVTQVFAQGTFDIPVFVRKKGSGITYFDTTLTSVDNQQNLQNRKQLSKSTAKLEIKRPDIGIIKYV